MEIQLSKLRDDDWARIREIYSEGIATGNATFETEAPGWAAWDAAHRSDCRLVALTGGHIVGWAALAPVSARQVYAGVAEVSVYVSASVRGHGIGMRLLTALIQESERAGIWTLQAGIFPENMASIALHEKCGFRKVGVRERLGQLRGQWRDVVLLERRSQLM
jgi:L-amino acid N-acyltransferase YncA